MKGYLEEEIFEGGAGLCWNYGRIQSVFDKKAQSSTATGRSWLLIEFVAWWGNFGQICTCGVRSYPGLRRSYPGLFLKWVLKYLQEMESCQKI